MSTYYGGTLDELHPDRNEVINDALERFENDSATKADLVLLWFDVIFNDVGCRAENAEAEVGRLRNELRDMTKAFAREKHKNLFRD